MDLNHVFATIYIVYSIIQIFCQSYTIFNPLEGSDEFYLNIIYNGNSLLVLVLIAISKKSKYPIQIVFGAIVISSLKASLRIFDFENTKGKLSEAEWSEMFINNLLASEMLYCFVLMGYQNVKFSKVFFLMHTFINNYLFIYHNSKINLQYLIYSIIMNLIGFYGGIKVHQMIEMMA